MSFKIDVSLLCIFNCLQPFLTDLVSVWSDHQGPGWIKADEFSRSESQVPFSTFEKLLSGVLTFLLLWGGQTKGDSGDSLARMTNKDTKENIMPEQYITTADVSPSHKWHPSHFSLRCVNDVCSHPS